MAGCECRKDIFKISYDNLASEVASQHRDWTPTHIRQETARLFRPSYHQNMDSVRKERSNEKVYQGPDFVFEGGQVNFVDGVRMRNILAFHETQLRDTPKEYSPEQHETSRLIQTAFQNGASEVATSYPEKKGQRDILVMKLDRTTGKGTSYIINTAPDGNDHTVSEIETIAKAHFEDFIETKAAQDVFIFSDVRVPKQQVQPVLQQIDKTIRELPRDAMYAAKGTVNEVAYTVSSVRRYIENKNTMEDIHIRPQERKTIVERVFDARKMETERRILPADVQKKKNKAQSVRLVAETPMTALVSAKRIEKATIVEKSVDRHERKEKKKIVRIESKRRSLLQKENRAKKRKEKKQKIQMKRKSERGILLFETKKPKTRKVQKEISLKTRIEKISKERVFRLISLVKKLIREKERMYITKVKRVEKQGVRRVEKKQNRQEHVLNFSIAFVFWLLLRRIELISQSKRFHVLIDESKNVRRKDEPLVVKEPTPWLLLAIIWHLTMIREQGYVQQQPKQKKVKRKIYYPRFARQGVIFAYAT